MISKRRRAFERSEASFRRRDGTRRPNRVVLVVCEGETEQAYFEALKRRFRVTTAQVFIADNTVGSSPGSVVRCALEKYRAEPDGYDAVYCVFDRDQHRDFDAASARIQELSRRTKKPIPLTAAVSVPCIEIWFLLHYEYSDAPHLNFASVSPVLRKHVPTYDKTNSAIRIVAGQMVERVELAIENARRLSEAGTAAGFANPYTSAHALAEEIIRLGR